jgi:hypothetical protein
MMEDETKDASQITYPAQYETEVVLTDGSAMVLRPIKVEDTARCLAFMSRLGTDSRYLWLHHIPTRMTLEDAKRFCTVD